MELRQLEYFVTVVDAGGFARAAERLHIVQSAVSQQIARLEHELGLALLERRRHVRLTPAGEAFLPQARVILAAVSQARALAVQISAEQGRILRIGTSEDLGECLETILAAFTEQRPDVEIKLLAANTHEKINALRTGHLDVAFVRAPPELSDLTVSHLCNSDLVAALPATHPTAAQAVVPLTDLADFPIAFPTSETVAGVAELINRACARVGFQPRRGPTYTNRQHLLVGPVATGRCWTVLYADLAARIPTRRVAFRPTSPTITIPTTLITRTPLTTPLLTQFLDAARLYAKDKGGDPPDTNA